MNGGSSSTSSHLPMAAPLVFDYVGVVFMSIFYGIYFLIFGLYWRIQLKRADRRRGASAVCYALTLNFILCTVYFIIAVILVQFYITMGVLDDDSLTSAVKWMVMADHTLYVAIDFISQLIMLYRCWVMWRQPLVMIFPCLLSLAFLVTTLTTLAFTIKAVANNLPLPNWCLSSVAAFFFLSLGVNAVVTALIVYKIITVYNEIRVFNNSNIRASARKNGRSDLNPLISILIESGLMTFVAQLAQCLTFRLSSDSAFPLISGVVVMLYGISMVVVLVRVETGVSYDNNTLGTVNSTNSEPSESMQRTPFALKFNKLERSDLSIANDAFSGSSFAQPDVVPQNLNYSTVTSTTNT